MGEIHRCNYCNRPFAFVVNIVIHIDLLSALFKYFSTVTKICGIELGNEVIAVNSEAN